jgi:hypothetical protein
LLKYNVKLIYIDTLHMSNFVCLKCSKSFSTKQRLDYHVLNVNCERKLYKCKYCNNKFSSRSSMYRHVKINCRINKDNYNEKEEILNRLVKLEEENKKIRVLERENKELKKMIQNNKGNIITTINNGDINIQQNINLIGFGKEDLSRLNRQDFIKILKEGYYSTLRLTEAIHFNPDHPEYHNIYISNIKDKYAMMFDGNNWTLTMKEDLINKIYNDKKDYIEENLDDFINSLTISRKNALKRWLDTEDNDDKIKDIKNQIKLLLYNRRDIPMKTQITSINEKLIMTE